MSLRCHFDANGWLQGPISITHVMTPNRYNSGFGTGQGVVFHTEAGYEQGTVETFLNPSSQVSAFFSIAQSGACHQYLPVGTPTVHGHRRLVMRRGVASRTRIVLTRLSPSPPRS